MDANVNDSVTPFSPSDVCVQFQHCNEKEEKEGEKNKKEGLRHSDIFSCVRAHFHWE